MPVFRTIILVCDGLGVGELPDAASYHDRGSNTLKHLAHAVRGVFLPNLERLGLGKIAEVPGIQSNLPALGGYGKMAEASMGKDTTTGHWEMTGIISRTPFPTYPKGFPREIIGPFQKAIGKKILGNKTASGTEILVELGEAHVKTGSPIVYTSADSVFQIACHEEIVPLEKLYEMCRIARSLLTGKHSVGRVIARPFLGTSKENFKRTENRRDFSVPPPEPTLLDFAKEKGCEVIGIGKIEDIFSGHGLTKAYHTGNNTTSMQKTIDLVKENSWKGILFTNLVDFDMLYGHRNDPRGYAKALERFDEQLGPLLGILQKSDLLFITGDHGCDPTDASTDHTREYVPILAYSGAVEREVALGIRQTFADLGATAAEALNLPFLPAGKSFLANLFAPSKVS